jgi:hypothetical protein
MLCSEIRWILAEEEEATRRKEALDSLVCMRSKLLCESLDERMKRAKDHGEWSHLTQKECVGLHKEEKLYLKSQVDRLRYEQAQTKGKLTELRRAKERAKLIRAARAASQQKRR